MRLDDRALQDLLDSGEADNVELKSRCTGDVTDKCRQAVCAFANDLPGKGPGYLIVGVDDSGKPIGLDVSDEFLRTLADIKSDGRILPPPSMSVERRAVAGGDIALVTVHPSDSPPVRYDGRIWIRVGTRQSIATAQDERILNERRVAPSTSFDARPALGATMDDLELTYVQLSYLPSAIARDVLEAKGRSIEEQLAALKFVVLPDRPVPTNVGLLVAGKSPQDFLPGAYVQFLKLDGCELSDPIVDEAHATGRLDDVVRLIEQKFAAHNQVRIDYQTADREKKRSTCPPTAFQQLFRNAIVHRTYEATNAPVRIYWFTDRIEIHSPGGPFGVVTAEKFGRPGVTDYRNPNLAEAFRNLGYIQRFGVGIAAAERALAENGNPPLITHVTSTHTLLTIKIR